MHIFDVISDEPRRPSANPHGSKKHWPQYRQQKSKHATQENHTQVSKLVSFTSGREDMEKTLQSSVNPADLSDGEEPSGLPPVPPPPLENEGACSPSLDLCTVKYSLFERKVKGIT